MGVLLFIKLGEDALDAKNMPTQLIVQEVGGPSPFENLELLANEIFLPVLSNPNNQSKWGEVPTREIMDKFHNFLSSTTIICGQIKGETRLPMPPIDLSGASSAGKNKISLLEGAIITWTKQIRSVLKQDPEAQLKAGYNPTPDVEIEFWKNKAANLNSIFEQLQGPKIRRVLRALDQSKSTYCTTFARLCKEVFSARMEANDNSKYLRTLEKWFSDLNSTDEFPMTVEVFKPMMHIILLIWKNSKHYNTSPRLVVLMREICNSLITQATKYVSGELIFAKIGAGEASEAVNMLRTTLTVCGTFKRTYYDYKATANAECPANPWKLQSKEVAKVFSTIVSLLQEFETQKIDEWSRDVEQSSQAKLKLPLVVRNPDTRALIVNFDPALVKLLREVKYFLLLGLSVPDSALDIYQHVETFRAWTGNLDLIVNTNNDVLDVLLPVEKPLVAPYLTKFDAVIEKGVSSLNWKSNGISDFISDSMEQVNVVNNIVQKMKENLRNINEQLEHYRKPILQRKLKPVSKDEFEKDHKNYVKERYTEIREGGKVIQNMVKDTNKELRCPPKSPDWISYVDFVNNVVVDGLSHIVQTSLGYLYDQIDPNNIARMDLKPMVEVKLDLVSTRGDDDVRYDEVQFIPDLLESDGKGVRDLINNWIGSFLNVATLFKRLDNEGTYLREMHGDQSICMLLAGLSDVLVENEEKCLQVKDTYVEHSYLWNTDLDTYFQKFCEDAMISVMTENGQEQQLIDLSKFEAAIVKYENVRSTIMQLESPMDVGWLRINTQPVKTQLTTRASKWIDMFMGHLRNNVSVKLIELDAFLLQIEDGLRRTLDVPEGQTELSEASRDLLKCIMIDIRDVKKADDLLKGTFEPHQQTLNILKAHGTDLSTLPKIREKLVQDYLDDAPMAWDNAVKKTLNKKEEIWNFQQQEMEKLKGSLEEFFLSMRAFRNDFRANAPFTFIGNPNEAYGMLDKHAIELVSIELQAKKFNELEELFELQVSKYTETTETRIEIKLLKYVWDIKALVLGTFESWNSLLWNDIHTDQLDDINKNLQKNLRKMAAETPVVKGWVVYRSIEDSIKEMSIILELVGSLHADSMRPRHWTQLAKVCDVEKI